MGAARTKSRLTFGSEIRRVFLTQGFEPGAHAIARFTDGVWTLVDTQRGFGDRWFINVGFALESLSAERPARVEHAHLYYRLESLVPSHHETIVVAGLLDDAEQADAFAALLSLLSGSIGDALREFGTASGLRRAWAEGSLANGLVTWQARDWLEGKRKGPESSDSGP